MLRVETKQKYNYTRVTSCSFYSNTTASYITLDMQDSLQFLITSSAENDCKLYNNIKDGVNARFPVKQSLSMSENTCGQFSGSI
jgi:hypothetical protein